MKDKELLKYFIKNEQSMKLYFDSLIEEDKHDKKFITDLIRWNTDVYKLLDKEMQEDIDILKVYLYNVKSNIDIVNKNNKLLKEKSIVMELIKIKPDIFGCLDKTMQNDIDVFEEYLKYSHNLIFARDIELLSRKDLLFEFIEYNCKIYEKLDKEMRRDEKIFNKCVEVSGFFKNNKHIYEDFKLVDVDLECFRDKSINIVKPFVASCCFPTSFSWMLSDKNAVLELIDVNGSIYHVIDDNLKKDSDILDKLFSKNNDIKLHGINSIIVREYVQKDIDIARIAVEHDNNYYYYLNEDFRNKIDSMNILPSYFESYEDMFKQNADSLDKYNYDIDKLTSPSHIGTGVKTDGNDPIDVDELISRIDEHIAQLEEEQILDSEKQENE